MLVVPAGDKNSETMEACCLLGLLLQQSQTLYAPAVVLVGSLGTMPVAVAVLIIRDSDSDVKLSGWVDGSVAGLVAG